MSESIENFDEATPAGEPAGGGGGGFTKAHRVLLAFGALATAAWLLSGIYQVRADEVAIVERLGMYLSNAQGKALPVEKGLHYHIPWPIDTVHKVSIQQTRNLIVNAFNVPPDAFADVKMDQKKRGMPDVWVNAIYDPYLITADENVVHVEIGVTYQIDDPESWLGTVSHSPSSGDMLDDKRQAVFQQMAQHALTARIAKMKVDDVIFQGRAELAEILKKALQEAMEVPDTKDPARRLDMGVKIQQVSIVNVRTPELVRAAFENVGQARRTEMETATVRAKALATALKTQAEGQAAVMKQQAEAYAKQVEESAKGEAARFGQIYKEYEKAPDVTRWNVFVDGIQSIAANARRLVFVKPGGKTWLPMDPIQFDAGQSTTKPGGI